MRHLVEPFALTALRRGRSIEQGPGVRRAEVRPTAEGFALVVRVAQDIGGDNFHDLVASPSFEREDGEEDFGCRIAVADDAAAALDIAEERVGTGRDRWVNLGLTGDDYRDHVRAGRHTSGRVTPAMRTVGTRDGQVSGCGERCRHDR